MLLFKVSMQYNKKWINKNSTLFEQMSVCHLYEFVEDGTAI